MKNGKPKYELNESFKKLKPNLFHKVKEKRSECGRKTIKNDGFLLWKGKHKNDLKEKIIFATLKTTLQIISFKIQKDFFQLKELERQCQKEKGITSMSVKVGLKKLNLYIYILFINLIIIQSKLFKKRKNYISNNFQSIKNIHNYTLSTINHIPFTGNPPEPGGWWHGWHRKDRHICVLLGIPQQSQPKCYFFVFLNISF